MAEVTILEDVGGDDATLGAAGTAEVLYTSTHRASAHAPEAIIIQNNTAIDVTIGGPDVADGSNGTKLVASKNSSLVMLLHAPGTEVWWDAASGTPTVSVLRVW